MRSTKYPRKSSRRAARSKPCKRWIKRICACGGQKVQRPAFTRMDFHRPAAIIAPIARQIALNEDVFRVLFTLSPEPKPAK